MYLYVSTVLATSNCADGSVRLHSAYNEWEGTVEVCISGVRGTVCDYSWDSRSADVICRQLGYPTLGKMTVHSNIINSMDNYTIL